MGLNNRKIQIILTSIQSRSWCLRPDVPRLKGVLFSNCEAQLFKPCALDNDNSADRIPDGGAMTHYRPGGARRGEPQDEDGKQVGRETDCIRHPQCPKPCIS